MSRKLDLYPIPSDTWQTEFDTLVSDSYVNTKYHRAKNITRFNRWINVYLPEVKTGSKTVLDIGPGFGEFLEICRSYGNDVFGIDASMEVISVMGNEYMRCAKLMTDRQQLNVLYHGFDKLIEEGALPYKDSYIDVINSIGCFEMMFEKFHVGESLKEHRNTTIISINTTPECKEYLLKVFKEIHRILKINGCFIIHFNAVKNMREFSQFMLDSIKSDINGLRLDKAETNTIFKFVKIN